MGQVVVTVNGRAVRIACDDGQEPRIRRLAQYVDAQGREFVESVGQVGEARLLLLAALVIADELSDANEALQQERSRSRAAERGRGRPMPRRAASTASPSGSRLLRRGWRHPSFAVAGWGCAVR